MNVTWYLEELEIEEEDEENVIKTNPEREKSK